MSFDRVSFKIDDLISELHNEIPMSKLTAPLEEKLSLTKNNNIENNDIFKLKETTSGEESVSIFYTQGNQTIYIAIFGPREMKIREKANGQYAKIELFTKFSMEITQSLQESINKKIKKFTKDMILRASYPKCQITFNINIFNISSLVDEYEILPIIFNGIMSALCLSGINIRMLCLAKAFISDEKCMIIMEMNDKEEDKDENFILYDFISEGEIDMNSFQKIVKEGKNALKNINKKLKNYIYKKIINN